MIELAVATGIAPSVWVEEGMPAIVTATELIEQALKKEGDSRG
ncbi:hypothetical protein [Jiangella asiatica]|nr:hypothetical protein [Jiangella asiatica]